MNKAQGNLQFEEMINKQKHTGFIMIEVLPLLLIVVVAASALLICWHQSIKIMHYHNKLVQAYAWGERYYWEGEALFLQAKQLTCQEQKLKVDNGADLHEVQLFRVLETVPFINSIHFKKSEKL